MPDGSTVVAVGSGLAETTGNSGPVGSWWKNESKESGASSVSEVSSETES